MDATLEAKKRDGRGKNEARRLRVSGRIPAVVYGARKDGQVPEGVPVAVDPKEVLRILHSESGANTLINLKLEGAEARVMVRDYQLAMDRAIIVSVPIVIKGEPAGVKVQGGLLDFVTRDIQVQVLPTDIPESIVVDVSELMLHQSIRVRDLAVDPKWKAVTDGETMLVHVVMPKAEEVVAPVADAAAAPVAAAGTEPEVIKKGKTDKEEEAPKKEAPKK